MCHLLLLWRNILKEAAYNVTHGAIPVEVEDPLAVAIPFYRTLMSS